MSKPQPGAIVVAAAGPAAKAPTSAPRPAKHEPAVHITPLALSAAQTPSAAATNPDSSPSRSGPASTSGPDPASGPASINSQNLAWDQAVLRIEYLVSTMTTPSPYSPVVSPVDIPSYTNQNLHGARSPLAVGGGGGGSGYHITPTSPPATPTDHQKTDDGLAAVDADPDVQLPPATKGWPQVPREKVRRKVLQIDTWRAEVASHGPASFCACSSPAPMIPAGAGDNAARSPTSPISPMSAVTPTSPTGLLSTSPTTAGGATALAPITIPPAIILCGFCGHPPSPSTVLKSPTGAGGMKKALVEGFRGLLRRRSGSRRGRDKNNKEAGAKGKVMDAFGAEKDTGKVKGGREADTPATAGQLARQVSATGADQDEAAPIQTEMYHVDMPPASAPPPPLESPTRKDQAAAAGYSHDADEEDVDLDELSQSTNPRGLLQSNDRLKRAEKLLAKNRGGGARATTGEAAQEKKIPPGGEAAGVVAGGNGAFGLAWGKNNGGARSRKGFGKLL